MTRRGILGTLLAAALGAAMGSCRHAAGNDAATASILPPHVHLRAGDLLFRRGMGVASRIVVATDVGGRYSHVGIVAPTDSGLMVVHAVPYEPDFSGDIDRVKAERPHDFFSCFKAQIGAVARCDDSVAAHKAALFARAACEAALPFDHRYDDGDTTRLYCCQLVTRSFAKAGVLLTPVGRHRIRLPGVIDACCTFPSDLCESSRLTLLITF